MIAEGRLLAEMSLQLALDVVDASSRLMVATVMIRYSWLQNSSIAPEVQQTIEDLPFDDHCCFLRKLTTLHYFKDSQATRQSLGFTHTGHKET